MTALMRQWARDAPDLAWKNCRGAGVSGEESCAGYHGVRPFLYCQGLRTSFDTSWRLFFAPLRQWGDAAPAPRVLISGAADFLIPAIVTQALRDAGREADVTVLDKCRTPLLMCKDAGPRLEMRWNIVQADIRELRLAATYDLIVSDRFLSFFAPAQRSSITCAWRALLRSRGRIITTVSIYPDAEPAARDRAALHLETMRRFEEEYGTLSADMTRDRLSRMVETYSSFRHEHFVRDPREVVAALEEDGLEVKEVRSIERKTNASSLAGATRYIAVIVADKAD